MALPLRCSLQCPWPLRESWRLAHLLDWLPKCRPEAALKADLSSGWPFGIDFHEGVVLLTAVLTLLLAACAVPQPLSLSLV